MQKTTRFIGDRYECGLLWKTNKVRLTPSFEMARKRLELLETKFTKDAAVNVLFKFREAPVAVCGDIREIFLQVAIKNEDIYSQRFLWRAANFSSPVKQCVMTRMLFGAACSPTIAQFIKNENE